MTPVLLHHLPPPLRPRRADRGLRGLLALAALLAAAGCASAPVETAGSGAAETEPVLSEAGKRYLENLYVFLCAPNYAAVPEGEAPPEAAAKQELREREECQRELVRDYTSIEAVRSLTWNGSGHSLSPAEMQGIVEYGPAYLDEYVDGLRRAAGVPSVAAAPPTSSE